MYFKTVKCEAEGHELRDVYRIREIYGSVATSPNDYRDAAVRFPMQLALDTSDTRSSPKLGRILTDQECCKWSNCVLASINFNGRSRSRFSLSNPVADH
eukprot:6174106-Pleurochrysis_carterae.AAC.1